MHNENSTTTEKDTNNVPAWLRWTAAISLATLAVIINGGANFYGGYLIAVELIGRHDLGYLVGGVLASIPVFQLATYLTRKRRTASTYLHIINALLLVMDISHFVYMSSSAVSGATVNIAQVDREIADINFKIQTAEKELSGLAVTTTGNNVQALIARINALKNTSVSGGALWDVSAGCTVGGYRTKCSQIATLQSQLDAEIAAVSGAEVVKKRGEIEKLRGMRTEKEGMKVGMIEKSTSAGFLMAFKPESYSNMAFSVMFSVPLAIALEIFLLIPFGIVADMTTPKKPEKRGMKGYELGYEIRVWIGEWIKTRADTQKRAAMVKAAAEGKERVIRDAEIAAKERDLAMQKTELSGNVAAYLKNMSAQEVGRLMNEKGCEATEKGKARLRNTVMLCFEYYEPSGRIAQSGDNAMFKKVGDNFKHFLKRVIPALITLGLAEKNDGVVTWVSKPQAWEAIGKPQIIHHTTEAKQSAPVQAKGKPVLKAIQGGKQ